MIEEASEVSALKAAEYYSEQILTNIDPLVRRAHAQVLRAALGTVIYGPTLRGYVNSAAHLGGFGGEFSGGEIPVGVVVQAVDLMAEAALGSEDVYKLNRPGVLQDPEFRRSIGTLHQNVQDGVIELMPSRFAMTPEEGRLQVANADEAFMARDSRVQRYLAGLNYATFTGKTMCTGTNLLAGRITDLRYWSERGIQEAMPHLVISNIAIGEVVSAIASRLSRNNTQLRIIDIGSGSGATVGGSVLGLVKGLESSGRRPNNIGIVGIESTVPMFEQLGEFGKIAVQRLNEIPELERPFASRLIRPGENVAVNSNELVFVNGDAANTIDKLEFPKEETRDGLAIVVANYSWHRFPTEVKDRMIQSTLGKFSNVVFLVADLAENGSEVNRRYFNFRDNGLLNCGNIHLPFLFRTNGMQFFALNQNTAPETMDSQLAQRIGAGPTGDSLFCIAYKGSLAQEVVKNW